MNGEIKTEGICPICGGKIVRNEKTFMGGRVAVAEGMPPFNCDNCGAMFAFPTPQVVSDQMKRGREATAANAGVLGALVSSW